MQVGGEDSTEIKERRIRKLIRDTKLRVNDGTLAHFCTLDEMREVARAAGLDVLECEYRTSSVVNAKLGLNMRRVLVHVKLQKPFRKGEEEISPLAFQTSPTNAR